ncbi:MAG: hypothetical protein JWN93_3117, partial [Hyphomicrobiales bacterium]|nr:hypothetical protein [Hyphomicrobiales bacterium]
GASSQPAAGAAAASAMSVTPGQSGADMLFRPQGATPPAAGQPADAAARPTPAAAGQTRTYTEARDDAARVFASSLRAGALSPADKQYLASVTAERTGMPQQQAEARVDQAFAAAQNAERQAREAADKARKSGAVAAFLTAAALLVSLAAAVAAAGLGGRHRDEGRAEYGFGVQRIW